MLLISKRLQNTPLTSLEIDHSTVHILIKEKPGRESGAILAPWEHFNVLSNSWELGDSNHVFGCL